MMVYIIIAAIAILIYMTVIMWRIFVKTGKPGWAVLIPGYNLWTLFSMTMGHGAKMFLLLVPVYGIYLIVMVNAELAYTFDHSFQFGIGILLLPIVFTAILAFGKAKYKGLSFEYLYKSPYHHPMYLKRSYGEPHHSYYEPGIRMLGPRN